MRLDEVLKSSAGAFVPQGEKGKAYWSGYWQRLRPKLQSADGRVASPGLFRSRRHLAAAAVVFVVGVLSIIAVQQYRTAHSLAEELLQAHAALEKLRSPDAYTGQDRLAVDHVLAAKDARLFREIDRALSSALEWVATDGAKIDLGMTRTLPLDARQAMPAPTGVVAIQLSLYSAQGGRKTLVSRVRIVARDGAWAEFSTRSSGLSQRYVCLPTIAADSRTVLNIGLAITDAQDDRANVIDTALTLENGEEIEGGTVVSGSVRYTIRVGLLILQPSARTEKKAMVS